MKNRKIVSGKEDDCLCSNLIKTNRYSALNFLPKNLMEQFSKKANIYFLVNYKLIFIFFSSFSQYHFKIINFTIVLIYKIEMAQPIF